MYKTVIIKNDTNRTSLNIVLNQLTNSHKFLVYSSDIFFLDSLDLPKNQKKKIRTTGEPKTFGDYLFFSLALPFLGIIGLVKTIKWKVMGVDNIILMSWQDQIVYTPLIKLLKLKTIWYYNRFLPNNFNLSIYSFILKLYSYLAKIICSSEAVLKDLVLKYKFSEKNTIVINRGIDLDRIKEQGTLYDSIVSKEYMPQNEALFIIGFIGDLKNDNGVEYLIKSVESFKELIPDFQIIIVGDGDQKKNLMWLTKMMKLSNHIRFVGKQDNPQRWYKYFDVFVLPRITKTNFANGVAEAMAHGIPIIASEVDGVIELVNNQGGILVQPGQSEELAGAIHHLYSNKGLREQFGLQAKARIREYYAMDKIVESYRANIS